MKPVINLTRGKCSASPALSFFTFIPHCYSGPQNTVLGPPLPAFSAALWACRHSTQVARNNCHQLCTPLILYFLSLCCTDLCLVVLVEIFHCRLSRIWNVTFCHCRFFAADVVACACYRRHSVGSALFEGRHFLLSPSSAVDICISV